jgi:hypothetical protein
MSPTAGLDDLELKANKPNDRVRLSDYDDDPEDKYRLLEKDQYTLLKYTADRGYVDAQACWLQSRGALMSKLQVGN